jgi:uncharacterized protein DUF4326
MPQRIQRKRTKGWRMPPNALYVGRPTLWGNPFPVKTYGRQGALDRFEAQLREKPAEELAQLLVSLRGKDLACFCRLDQPCHADVWLRLANAGGV